MCNLKRQCLTGDAILYMHMKYIYFNPKKLYATTNEILRYRDCHGYRKTLSRYMLLSTANWKIREAVARHSNAHNKSSTAFTKFKAAESSNASSSSR